MIFQHLKPMDKNEVWGFTDFHIHKSLGSTPCWFPSIYYTYLSSFLHSPPIIKSLSLHEHWQ